MPAKRFDAADADEVAVVVAVLALVGASSSAGSGITSMPDGIV